MSGSYYTNINFFENTGDDSNPSFAASQTNPFGLTDVGDNAVPTLADIDGDGDLDTFVGNENGNINFFENTGDASNPSFATAQTNPFGLTNVGDNAVPTLADIDGDGDLDVLTGEHLGNINFFENIGDASNPSFTTAETNPFGLTNVGDNAVPTLADIDGDGDLDAFVGNENGNINFFENTGDASNPSFATAQTNPFGLTDVGDNAVPTLADIDGDGDLDAFVGNFDGKVDSDDSYNSGEQDVENYYYPDYWWSWSDYDYPTYWDIFNDDWYDYYDQNYWSDYDYPTYWDIFNDDWYDYYDQNYWYSYYYYFAYDLDYDGDIDLWGWDILDKYSDDDWAYWYYSWDWIDYYYNDGYDPDWYDYYIP